MEKKNNWLTSVPTTICFFCQPFSCKACPGNDVGAKTGFPDMPCMKRVYRDKIGVGTLVTIQERRALFVPLINRLSTARHVPQAVFKYELEYSFFRRDVQESVYDSLEGKRESCVLAGLTRQRPVLPSRAPSRRAAVRRPDPSGPWCVRVLDSTGYELDCSCFRRDVQDGCLRYPGAEEGKMFPVRDEPSTSLLARPSLAPPLRRRPAPTRPWYVRVLDSAGLTSSFQIDIHDSYLRHEGGSFRGEL